MILLIPHSHDYRAGVHLRFQVQGLGAAAPYIPPNQQGKDDFVQKSRRGSGLRTSSLEFRGYSELPNHSEGQVQRVEHDCWLIFESCGQSAQCVPGKRGNSISK